MIRGLAVALAILAAVPGAAAQSIQLTPARDTLDLAEVHLRALDTLNGTTSDIDMAVGEATRFGSLEIHADACRVPSDAPKADAYAFLRIRDTRHEKMQFSGWMFASSPALSAMDDPRYDVWVVSCNNR